MMTFKITFVTTFCLPSSFMNNKVLQYVITLVCVKINYSFNHGIFNIHLFFKCNINCVYFICY